MTQNLASLGHAARMGAARETAYGVAPGPVDEAIEFVSESLTKRGTVGERTGLRGTRGHQTLDTCVGPSVINGQLVLEPAAADLALWLPRILGGLPTGTNPKSFRLAETLPSFTLGIDRIAKVFTYTGCKVQRATFLAARGRIVRLVIDIVAQRETISDAGSLPQLTRVSAPPFLFSDISLELAGAARELWELELVIDNCLVADRFINSVTIVDLPEGDRTIQLRTRHSWNADTTDLYTQALAGAPGVLTFANPAEGLATTFHFGALQLPDHSPHVPSRRELFLNLEMQARRSSLAAELFVTQSLIV